MKGKFKIPRYVTVGAHRLRIRYSKNIHKKKNAVGIAVPYTNEIWLQADVKDFPSAPSQQRQWYFHELLHHILNAMNESKLNENDDFVDNLAQYLTQAIESEEF
jgi:hypothetical protein